MTGHNCDMDRISIDELAQHADALVARAQHGETLAITSDGLVVARLTPPPVRGLDDLVRRGRVVPATDHGPIPLPPVLGDPTSDTAAELTTCRGEEHR